MDRIENRMLARAQINANVLTILQNMALLWDSIEAATQAFNQLIIALSEFNPWIYNVDTYICFYCRQSQITGHAEGCPFLMFESVRDAYNATYAECECQGCAENNCSE